MIRLIYLVLVILTIVGMWKVFVKAGRPGWACIIPFYNLYVLIEIAGKPGWWLILFFIPLVNIVFDIIVSIALAQKFGKDIGFAIGLILLPFIFVPILGLGDAKYQSSPPAAQPQV